MAQSTESRRLKLIVLRNDDGPVYGIGEEVQGFESRDPREIEDKIARLEGGHDELLRDTRFR